jgi:pimeloyl-ACP methyl ester carboxylesterase
MNKSGFADINRTQLYYEVAGSGTPLVLIHGFSLDHRMWDDQFQEFSKRFQVIRYDLRGFGRSSLPTSDPYDHIDDLNQLLDQLQISNANLLGLSLGGNIALNYTLTIPDRVDTLILVDSGLPGFNWQGERPPELAAQYAKQHGVVAGKKYWSELDIFSISRSRPEVMKQIHQMLEDYSGWHWQNKNPMHIHQPPAASRLDTIKIPTQVIVGEHDLPGYLDIARYLHEHIHGSSLKIIKQAGHISNMDQADVFNNTVIDFLNHYE